ncbi:MAG: Sodium-dependent transporter [uncultured Nocardioidaceae bacterium]|uniref:Sodium-dependent transporter n=1 Tax=uncultured Nocardioidaceae bacterium TaxID=253824 RepID=A0A6J4L902_9ACTN|nr:MAG: Sodium-dependent transporter [uncultured Nocardioidaceae bacterium]
MSSSVNDEQTRDQWGTKLGFILAAMGSAIGLGNIWRYPYVVYENGGGAFLIPYFVALATAGLPILILEYSLGHRYRQGAPATFHFVSRRWEGLGWWMAGISFMIATYYVVILGWCLSFIWYSLGEQWGEDTGAFFIGEYLATSSGAAPEGFWELGGLQWKVLVPTLIAWAMVYFLLQRGVSKGIEMASRILMPALIVMLLVIVLRAVTLDGAANGLDVLFTPDFSALGDAAVWVAAYGQVFFSLSIAFSIMIAYSSYLPSRTDLSNSGLIVGLSNASFEFLAAIGVFAALGFLAGVSGVPVTEVVESGVVLAFVVFPQVISALPALNSVFGVLFFATLFFAGITSMVSILEAVIAAIREKFDLSRRAAVNWVCGMAGVISLLYVTEGGLFYLDTVDHFVNAYGLVVAGLAEVLLVAWIARTLNEQREHIDSMSYVKVGSWWTISLKFITPVLLGFMVVYGLWQEFAEPYEGYPGSGLVIIGAGSVLLTLLLAMALSLNSRAPHDDLVHAGKK